MECTVDGGSSIGTDEGESRSTRIGDADEPLWTVVADCDGLWVVDTEDALWKDTGAMVMFDRSGLRVGERSVSILAVGTSVGGCDVSNVGAAVQIVVGIGSSFVGVEVGAAIGVGVATYVGRAVGSFDGMRVGIGVACTVIGNSVGGSVGMTVGRSVMISVGGSVGNSVGGAVGMTVGTCVGDVVTEWVGS
jgi:hypothetical protein